MKFRNFRKLGFSQEFSRWAPPRHVPKPGIPGNESLSNVVLVSGNGRRNFRILVYQLCNVTDAIPKLKIVRNLKRVQWLMQTWYPFSQHPVPKKGRHS